MLGKTIKELRNNKSLSQRELAKALGISASAVAMYETDQREPDIEMLTKMADFFNCSIDTLLGKTTESRTSQGISDQDAGKDTFQPVLSEKELETLRKKAEAVYDYTRYNLSRDDDSPEIDEEDEEALKEGIFELLQKTTLSCKKKYTPKKYRK